ncbi:hypothetical protein GQ43DRAFT_486582 [Delitschia confertaspora ATCC 74209]|uniref:N-acetylgalactosaminide beta-1,3-galactosyltransferase n=1 Tax=Delitschia confertaspora ATCC 74209 TaxID=1513339 RepID=A0A9P4JVU0_9PLEO|nr:hypothetical protein GQ43DRAFT_486582 [Delitschia confertaspora ATCC 74209]
MTVLHIPSMPTLLNVLLRRPIRWLSLSLIVLYLFFTLNQGGSPSTATFPGAFTSLVRIKSPFYSGSKSPYYSYETKPFFLPLGNSDETDLCAGFPNLVLDSVSVVLKTGAGESAKTAAHLETVTSCILNIIVVSDLEEDVGNHHFIDILAHLPPSYFENNPDFDVYKSNKAAHEKGDVIKYSKEGWKLDRFKFLPMVEKAYEMRPNAKWYIFIESDVYYFWDNLFRLLDQLDSEDMHYMGSPAPGSNNRVFGYGGGGFVISHGLMERLVGDAATGAKRISEQYEDWIRNDCCGDSVLGYVILEKTGVKLQALYPTFAGDEIKSLRIGREWWCVPLIALHRVGPEQDKSLWEWERKRDFLPYIHPHLSKSPTLDNWDNFSSDKQPDSSPAHASATACRSACTANPDCLQYKYSPKSCWFGKYVQLGNSVNKDEGEIISGWDIEKMRELGWQPDGDGGVSGMCKDGAQWMRPTNR